MTAPAPFRKVLDRLNEVANLLSRCRLLSDNLSNNPGDYQVARRLHTQINLCVSLVAYATADTAAAVDAEPAADPAPAAPAAGQAMAFGLRQMFDLMTSGPAVAAECSKYTKAPTAEAWASLSEPARRACQLAGFTEPAKGKAA